MALGTYTHTCAHARTRTHTHTLTSHKHTNIPHKSDFKKPGTPGLKKYSLQCLSSINVARKAVCKHCQSSNNDWLNDDHIMRTTVISHCLTVGMLYW